MSDHDKKRSEALEAGRTIAAAFLSREEARAAIKGLHKSDFKHTWLGATSVAERASGQATATVETGGFFAGTESLVDALVKRGVDGEAARQLETRIEPGNAVLTVDPKDHDPQPAISILTSHGGRVADGSSAAEWGSWPTSAGMLDDADPYDDVVYEEILFSRS